MPLPLAKIVVVAIGTLSSWFLSQLGRNADGRMRERQRAQRRNGWKITLIASVVLLAIGGFFWSVNDGSGIGKFFLLLAIPCGFLGVLLLIVGLLQFAFKDRR